MASYFSGGIRLGFSPPPQPWIIRPWSQLTMRVVNILAGTKFWEIFTKTTKPHGLPRNPNMEGRREGGRKEGRRECVRTDVIGQFTVHMG